MKNIQQKQADLKIKISQMGPSYHNLYEKLTDSKRLSGLSSEEKYDFYIQTADYVLGLEGKRIDVDDFNDDSHIAAVSTFTNDEWRNYPMGKKVWMVLKYFPSILLLISAPLLGDYLYSGLKNSNWDPNRILSLSMVTVLQILLGLVVLAYFFSVLSRKYHVMLSGDTKAEVKEFIKVYAIIILFIIALLLINVLLNPSAYIFATFNINVPIYFIVLIILQILLIIFSRRRN